MTNSQTKGVGHSKHSVVSVHPMVGVPDAIRLILRETARYWIHHNPHNEDMTVVQLAADQDTQAANIMGHVLAQDVIMQEPGYPPYRASIMDGYCVQSSSASHDQYHVVDNVYAGDEQKEKPTTIQENVPVAYYVTTGAMVPQSFDCVVPIEDVIVHQEGDSKMITIPTLPTPLGKWIRPVGCDIPCQSVVLPAGHVMDPVSLGLVRQSGNTSIVVRRPVVVGLLSTGNEIMDNWSLTIDGVQGKIPDVNKPVLYHALQELGICQVQYLGTCRDDNPEAMANIIQQAMATCQVIITTGGISMGETDIVEDVLVKLGGIVHFGRIHMKPGKPSTFVTIPGPTTTRFVFALPGNPVSAVVCLHLLVRPSLALLHEGCKEPPAVSDSIEEQMARIVENATLAPPETMARLAHDVPLDIERPEYHRVRLQYQQHEWIATSTGVQRSSRLMSLRDADALLSLPQGTPQKSKALAGEMYPALLLKANWMPKMTISQSKHLATKKAPLYRVDVVQLGGADLEDMKERVQKSLLDAEMDAFGVATTRSFNGKPEHLFDFVNEGSADLYVVVGYSGTASIASNATASSHLRSRLCKVADAIALQIKRGAAGQSPTAALFETVVGVVEGTPKSLLILVPSDGLARGLHQVRGILVHALELARGTNHSHHHGKKH